MAAVARKSEAIFNDLKSAILDGDLAPGAPLPSAHDLGEQYDTTRVTVRRALARLVADGLIELRQGAVARVCPAPLVRISIVGADWRRHREAQRPGFNATVAEHGLIGRQEVLEVHDGIPAPAHIADALDVEDDTPMVMRFVRMYADDTPVRLARSWFPAEWASGTALADRRKVRGGVARLVEELRGRLAFSDVDLEPRKPSDEEADLLGLGRSIGVVQTVTTFMDEAEVPVFVQQEVSDASRHRWRFRVTL